MQSGGNKHVDVARLKADLVRRGVELLSAHCAADRVRLQYSPQDIVSFGERTALKRAIASAESALQLLLPNRGPASTPGRRQIEPSYSAHPTSCCTPPAWHHRTISPRG